MEINIACSSSLIPRPKKKKVDSDGGDQERLEYCRKYGVYRIKEHNYDTEQNCS